MKQINRFLLQTSGLEKQFYEFLGKTQNYERFHECFFEYKQNKEIDNTYILFQPFQDQRKQLWNQINNGLKYALIFDYIFFQRMENINPEHISQQYQTSYIELFVRYPGDNQIYSHVREKSLHRYNHQAKAIAATSQITLDLNQSLLYHNWQKQFHKNLIQSQNIHKFELNFQTSFDERMREKKMYQEIKKNQQPKLWSRNWYFISKLRQFKDDKNIDILQGSCGCGPLIRSVAFFEVFIQMINQLKKINKGVPQIGQKNFKDIKNEFVERIVYYYMLCQHDQAQLTHYSFQGQMCILLLSFIQIKLILRQSLDQRNKNVFQAVKELIIEFRDNHFSKIINAYFEQQVDVNQLVDQVHKLIANKQQENIQYKWQKYLNINRKFIPDVANKKQILENHIMLLYYCLFYQNKNGQFNWEDPDFFNYLLQKEGTQIGYFNQDIYHPNLNSKSLKSKVIKSLKKYDELLQKPYVINFEQYAPNILFLVFHILSKQNESNKDIFDILSEACQLNLYSQSHGPILAAILSSYDFNYHVNYINSGNKNRDDFMNHFLRMDLQTFDIKNRMLFSQYFLNKMIKNEEQ
ncbi:hypothetical protein ABPG74_003880 [Tetrahymena malaccensis]